MNDTPSLEDPFKNIASSEGRPGGIDVGEAVGPLPKNMPIVSTSTRGGTGSDEPRCQ